MIEVRPSNIVDSQFYFYILKLHISFTFRAASSMDDCVYKEWTDCISSSSGLLMEASPEDDRPQTRLFLGVAWSIASKLSPRRSTGATWRHAYRGYLTQIHIHNEVICLNERFNTSEVRKDSSVWRRQEPELKSTNCPSPIQKCNKSRVRRYTFVLSDEGSSFALPFDD